MSNIQTEIRNLSNLNKYIKEQRYLGYDPYDALNSPYLKNSKSRWTRLIFTQLLRRSPLNFRKVLGVRKGLNSKALGLILSSYSSMGKLGIGNVKSSADFLFNLLLKKSCKGYSGYCWGYNFDWQNYSRLLPKDIPTVVNTSYIAHSFLDYFDYTKKREALDAAVTCCNFIINDLNTFEDDDGICFSYTPIERNIVHNANLLGASILARTYRYNKVPKLRDYSIDAFNFTMSKQHNDGNWDYSIEASDNSVKVQNDWHQGFILESIIHFLDSIDSKNRDYISSLRKGAKFYSRQFTDEGAGYWRYPLFYPINIHNQSQGIITFTKLADYFEEYDLLADKILDFTNRYFLSSEGYYYHQIIGMLTDKTSYMRWGQAWMMLALTTFVKHRLDKNSRKA